MQFQVVLVVVDYGSYRTTFFQHIYGLWIIMFYVSMPRKSRVICPILLYNKFSLYSMSNSPYYKTIVRPHL